MVARTLALEPTERARQESVLIEQFPLLPGFERAGTVLLYVSVFPEEFATTPLLEHSLKLGKRLLCPRVDRAARRLVLYEVADLARDLVPGTKGIPEPRLDARMADPVQVDWVLVPGIAYDERGFRLGRGAGHYDRLLPTLRPDVMRWALAFDCQWVEALPVEPHDIPLDGVVSPGKKFTRT